MRKRIVVTKTAIKRATPGFGTCPVARAARRALGSKVYGVAPKFISIKGACSDSGWYKSPVIPLPPRAQAFIKRYDDDLPVKPFSFWVEVP